ncbi:hypothetical protein [Flavilitoribacter nigricans]|uniref:Uncharacterized protein n=1 Tax=Flavilitoribacter nigricans (strain ATCC 23147 / DSM 23189 / NBRC 102662 / NCIMB 1420 / SS-2) TaxID=1122177 RepID=A0A2D0NBL8_FLAN2|nr:hypothetical protein [Flavilitoribacter nigricans]PHN05760.1 hypothetical protein CRP01_14895 [Flavilitoribacter nigricans DSM 23189 = NBRC 102662]
MPFTKLETKIPFGFSQVKVWNLIRLKGGFEAAFFSFNRDKKKLGLRHVSLTQVNQKLKTTISFNLKLGQFRENENPGAGCLSIFRQIIDVFDSRQIYNQIDAFGKSVRANLFFSIVFPNPHVLFMHFEWKNNFRFVETSIDE